MNSGGKRRRNRSVSNILCAALCAALYAAVPAVHAQSAASGESIRQYDIPAGSLSSALGAWGAQSDRQVVFAPDLVAGKQTKGVSGQYGAEQALAQLLAGTGLTWKRVNAQTYALEKTPPPQPVNTNQKPASKSGTSPSAAAEKPTQLDAVSVTGTRIRGGVTASPTITIGAQQIQDEGFTDLGEVIRSVPQNYAGGQNPGVTAGAYLGGYNNQNTSGGSAANLRGIGQDASLTLLDGRRMSYGGNDQSVDISAIPVEAVDRIEIVTDGASAIYGSDAVGGVINVMLKRDFDGVAVGARYGTATEGGLATHEYNATAGTTWSTGGLIATWKNESNDPIYWDQRDYTRQMYGPTTLYQGADLHSGLISLHQSVGESVELHLDALSTERNMQTQYGYATVYDTYPTRTTTVLGSPSVTFMLPHDWTINVSAAAGRDQTQFHALGVMRATNEAYLDRSYNYSNKSRTYEVEGEGPVFSLPGGDARLAVGAGYRYNDFLYVYEGDSIADGDEGSRFAYAELNLPLVGPTQDVAGVHRLELTGAIRTENHDSYGRVTTPKVGLIYSPAPDWTLKGSWGKSFKAPTLFEGYIAQFSYLYPASIFGSGYAPDATVLYLNGGNLDLAPERAKTWSASVAFHPEALPRLETEFTAFHIDYNQRIIQPITDISGLLANPIYVDFVAHDPTAQEKAEALASTVFTNYTGSPYDPDKLVAIVDNRFVNASRQRIQGIDLSGSYRFDLANSRLALRSSVSWLDSERALTQTSAFSPSSGILFYPAKFSGRAGAVWTRDGLTASLFGNYKSGVTDPADGTKGGSFTTFDLTVRYDTGARDSSFSNMTFEASAQNLFNRDPPLYVVTDLGNAPYDSTNYSAIGRFLSVSIAKRW
jgi:outer membrane receptor protein involved in Fe transport